MKFSVITPLPEIFDSFLKAGILGKAIKKGIIEVEVVDLKKFGKGETKKKIDEKEYGGGPGMLIMIEPVVKAIEKLKTPDSYVIHLTPKGEVFNQDMAKEFSKLKHIILISGRYEGIDARIKYFVQREVSTGRYILMGGEVAAMCIIEAVSRLIKGVVGNEESLKIESFSSGYYEEDKYTRPRVFRGLSVPDVLLSGDRKKIDEWRKANRIKI